MTLTIRKYIKGTNREPLAGVCFKVTEGSGTPVGSGDGTYYTNSAGEIVIEKSQRWKDSCWTASPKASKSKRGKRPRS